MTKEEFSTRHKAIITKYDVCFCDNCDMKSMVNGFIYYKNPPNSGGKFVCHIRGIYYDDIIGMGGDFEGYLELLEDTLGKILDNPINKAQAATETP